MHLVHGRRSLLHRLGLRTAPRGYLGRYPLDLAGDRLHIKRCLLHTAYHVLEPDDHAVQSPPEHSKLVTGDNVYTSGKVAGRNVRCHTYSFLCRYNDHLSCHDIDHHNQRKHDCDACTEQQEYYSPDILPNTCLRESHRYRAQLGSAYLDVYGYFKDVEPRLHLECKRRRTVRHVLRKEFPQLGILPIETDVDIAQSRT